MPTVKGGGGAVFGGFRGYFNPNASIPEVKGASVVVADPANLAKYGIAEGGLISAIDAGDPDIYVVNAAGYKRLFLNPVIFGFYGQLGGWAKVKHVSIAARDAFPTSSYVKNCDVSDGKVYASEATGEDAGVLHWINLSADQATAQDANFFAKVFCINTQEFNWFTQSATVFTDLSKVASYQR